MPTDPDPTTDLVEALVSAGGTCSEGHQCFACRREARDNLAAIFTVAGFGHGDDGEVTVARGPRPAEPHGNPIYRIAGTARSVAPIPDEEPF